MPDTFVLETPAAAQMLPLVFDSPHSGQLFPADFVSNVDAAQLRTGCDLFVNDLWAAVPEHGGHLLHALYSRMYIDLNRAPDDIDPLLLDGAADEIKPTAYSERGMGLIRRLALPDVPLYTSPLSMPEIHSRIQCYYKPYHQQLKSTLDALYRRFGAVWHVDCHSMKSRGNRMNIDSGALRPDVVLGDNDGGSAGADSVEIVAQGFLQRGYTVARNVPYNGGYLVRHYGDPDRNRHSMQIEINRALYLDEQSFSPTANFPALQKDLGAISKALAEFVRDSITSNR